jgi:hypothetical protein
MKNSLESILDLLIKINDQCKREVISKDVFDEEKQNIKDFEKVLSETPKLIESISNSNDTNEIVEKLIYLHLNLSDSIWHIEQIHELVKLMAGKYRESI